MKRISFLNALRCSGVRLPGGRLTSRAESAQFERVIQRLLGLSFASVLLLLFAFSEQAEGAASEALTLEELIDRADCIAHVRADAARSRYDGRRIVTEVDLSVERPIADISSRRKLRLLVPGGVVDGIGMRVEGAPRFRSGEEAVVFATETERGLRTVGMSQGVFPVEARGEARLVHPSGRGLALYRRGPNGRLMRSAGAIEAPMPLEAFIARIEKSLEPR